MNQVRLTGRLRRRPGLIALCIVASALLTGWCAYAADVPRRVIAHVPTPPAVSSAKRYFWKVAPLPNGAEMLTLFCRSCDLIAGSSYGDVPLVTVLRDTLGDQSVENDRLRYVWLLTYVRPTIGQRALSAVPFFYWHVGHGQTKVGPQSEGPIMNLAAPRSPVIATMGRNIVQWALFDTMFTPVRASSRAYRDNGIDHERLYLEETISYLRNAPVGHPANALTAAELNWTLARLSLRKKMLGGLVSDRNALAYGEDDTFQQEEVRARNWDLLRQCADKTGLLFEPINIGANSEQYALLWFPINEPYTPPSNSLKPVWRVLNISNPRSRKDPRWQESGLIFNRSLDGQGKLLSGGTTGARTVQLIPVGVYSLSYQKQPLLMVDFHDSYHLRRREMLQRGIDDVTISVLGLSHFGNWYWFAASAAYNFVSSHRGYSLNRNDRLDCYSRFRVAIAMDHHLDPALRAEIDRRVHSLALNPLNGNPEAEVSIAQARYQQLLGETAVDESIARRLDKDRRRELAQFGGSEQSNISDDVLQTMTLGLYTHRAKADAANLAELDRERRITHDLDFLESLVAAGTYPEVAHDSSTISSAVAELSRLSGGSSLPAMRARIEKAVSSLGALSRDSSLQADCSEALRTMHKQDAREPAVSKPEAPAAGSASLPVNTGSANTAFRRP